MMDKGTTSTDLVIVHGTTLGKALLEEPNQLALMEGAYCKILFPVIRIFLFYFYFIQCLYSLSPVV